MRELVSSEALGCKIAWEGGLGEYILYAEDIDDCDVPESCREAFRVARAAMQKLEDELRACGGLED